MSLDNFGLKVNGKEIKQKPKPKNKCCGCCGEPNIKKCWVYHKSKLDRAKERCYNCPRRVRCLCPKKV